MTILLMSIFQPKALSRALAVGVVRCSLGRAARVKAARLAFASDSHAVALAVGCDCKLDPRARAVFLLRVGDELRIRILLSACQQVAMHLINYGCFRQAA